MTTATHQTARPLLPQTPADLAARHEEVVRDFHHVFNSGDVKRAHAYRLMEAAAVVSPIGDNAAGITTESQARELARVEPEKRQEVVKRAVAATKEAAKPVIELEPEANEPRRKKWRSRAARYGDARALASEAKAEVEQLRDELQTWLDGMPDNLQGGSKAEELQTAIDELESVIDALDQVEFATVEFPSMSG
jgi:hypothetical protein